MTAPEKTGVGTVIENFLPELCIKKGVSKQQFKILNALRKCKTKEMGGEMMACSTCGTTRFVFYSCRNRHCPKCQGIEREMWIEARKAEILPVKYFHVVFTVPHSLLEIFRFHPKEAYGLLFQKSWGTLNKFGNDSKWLGAQLGAIAILHTWDQQLRLHPHIHFIIPAGGISKDRVWKNSKTKGDYLFDIYQLSDVFRASFVKSLRQLKRKGIIRKTVPKNLFDKEWVVYAKQAFASPENVIEYLGRYTHRVAIADSRIKDVNKSTVTFTYRNRKKDNIIQYKTLPGDQFLARFIQHIMPHGFSRIRHYGFLSSKRKSADLTAIRKNLKIDTIPVSVKTKKEIMLEKWGIDHKICKECQGELVLIEVFERERAPPQKQRELPINTEFYSEKTTL